MNPYEVLGVDVNADISEIKKAYRNLSKKHHPDIGGDEKEFHKINIAYRILSDQKKRAMYDETGTVQDDMSTSVADKVRDRIISMTNGWLDSILKGQKKSLKDFVNFHIVENGIQKIERVNEDIKDDIDELKKIKEKVVCKDESNIVCSVIDKRIKNYESAIKMNEKEKEMLEMMVERLNKYECEFIKDVSSEHDLLLFRAFNFTQGA